MRNYGPILYIITLHVDSRSTGYLRIHILSLLQLKRVYLSPPGYNTLPVVSILGPRSDGLGYIVIL